jgi:crossover junction endodeoxyribonuclease RuvC
MGVVFGVDVSLTYPGYAVLADRKKVYIDSLKTGFLRGAERWQAIHSVFSDVIAKHRPDRIVFENYGFNSHRIAVLAEIGGILRFSAFTHKIPYADVAPNSLKKFFTGDGNADKQEMMREAFKRGFICRNDNEADAVALALWGFEKFEKS